MDLRKDLHHFRGAKYLSFYISCDMHHLCGLAFAPKNYFSVEKK